MDLAGADVQIARNIERIKAESRIREREQRRYEIARDVMAGLRRHYGLMSKVEDQIVRTAVRDADALLAALETER